MVQEAEKYKAEDEKQRDKVSSKNSLESYAFNMKATVEDEKLQGKINDEDKQKILDKCNEIISWLDKNQVGILPVSGGSRSTFSRIGLSSGVTMMNGPKHSRFPPECQAMLAVTFLGCLSDSKLRDRFLL